MKTTKAEVRKPEQSLVTVYGLNVEKFQAPKSRLIFERMWREQPDIICLQETTRAVPDFPDYAQPNRHGYYASDNYDPRAAAAGVAIFSKHPSVPGSSALCDHDDCGGRFVEVSIGDLRVASVYAYANPSDKKKEDRERRKRSRRQFYACLGSYMRRNAGDQCIIVTDLNVALTYSDVANTRQWAGPWANEGDGTYREAIVNAMHGFARWADSFRIVYGCHQRRATVWYDPASFAGKDGADQGFGIDYQLVSNSLRGKVAGADVIKSCTWEERFSNHALTIGRYYSHTCGLREP